MNCVLNVICDFWVNGLVVCYLVELIFMYYFGVLFGFMV